MIKGVHTLLDSPDTPAPRVFIRDKLGFSCTDVITDAGFGLTTHFNMPGVRVQYSGP